MKGESLTSSTNGPKVDDRKLVEGSGDLGSVFLF